jgi:RNA polymerase sigma-B factor
MEGSVGRSTAPPAECAPAPRTGHSEELLRAYRRTGDPALRDRLVERYLPLVRALARRYAGCGEPVEDLVQVGSIGLIGAIDRFDPARGDDFLRFAVPTITGEIKRHLRDRTASIRPPRRLGELTLALRPSRDRLATRLSRPPTTEELALEAGVCERDVAEALWSELLRAPVPLSGVDEADGVGTTGSRGAYDECDDRLLLAAGFRVLTARQRRILHLRYYAGLSQSEIAREVGLSQVQVSRLIRMSLERMLPVVAAGERPVVERVGV